MNVNQIKDRLDELHAQSIVILHTADKTILCDHMILATVTSHRQMRFIANTLLKESGEKRQYTENAPEEEWMLIDLGDIMIHIMTPDARINIDLESLWSNRE
ncbi:ribosome silencing factor [Candidatus Synchoanobacter obligatus]|uniref:Ribosome silencing factor n=1 Tax=Candidatus Synchoanobacter obligatus TaxID=2919597 RepID=A0ABT1L3I0_9GAMM|nr:ribosome silencing factor [Candidatus Synchoanobacter obligatus]MCP8351776.1 ribosome silencing factor [Candidatus Synchoanobacter obligatus]